jgi:formylglycine-generating enzyme required for sulfatase activity
MRACLRGPWKGMMVRGCALAASVMVVAVAQSSADSSLGGRGAVGSADGQTNLFVNSLGMKFAVVPNARVRFAVWETRVRDYQVFCAETGRAWAKPDFPQGPDHPVVNVNWEDAAAFCEWLTARERKTGALADKDRYRLPTDREWSQAAKTAAEDGSTPEDRMKSGRTWPWGNYWPPLAGDGNYGVLLKLDEFPKTSPVGHFKANDSGLFDMGGNVWEWCEDWYNEARVTRALRGASFNDDQPAYLLTSYRFSGTMNLSSDDIGFRVVLERGN